MSDTLPLPSEVARLAELQRLCVLDTLEEQAYDDITRMAADICGTPIAVISLIDDKRQWFKSRVGLQVSETPRELAFCAHAIQTPGQPMVVNDATKDARFESNPLVVGDPNIRFYAGAPLVTSNGHALGTVCVIDREPRDITPEQLEQLQFMAQQVILMLEARVAPAKPD
ncbi:MAG: GAF domain-containing protein [Pseudomonadota bacterium]